MSRPLARPHSLNIEDVVWDRLVEHSGKRGESASAFTNLVLRDALGLIPHSGPEIEYVPGDIPRSANKIPTQAFDPKTIAGVKTGRQLFEERKAEEARKMYLRSHPEDESQDAEDLL